MTAPAPSPAEQAMIERFGIFAEERVVEEVAFAIWGTTMRDEMTWEDWRRLRYEDDRRFYREQAAAAVTAYRATQDGGADLATALADQGLRSCCGQPSAEHCR